MDSLESGDTMGRVLSQIVALGVAAGMLGWIASAMTGLQASWIITPLIATGVAAIFWNATASEAPAAAPTAVGGTIAYGDVWTDRAWISPAFLATGGWIILAGIFMLYSQPLVPWVGLLIMLPGFAIGLSGLARTLKRKPTARETAVQDNADRLGGMFAMQLATLGGVLDLSGIMDLSGTQVGFAAVAGGMLGVVSAQAWLLYKAGL